MGMTIPSSKYDDLSYFRIENNSRGTVTSPAPKTVAINLHVKESALHYLQSCWLSNLWELALWVISVTGVMWTEGVAMCKMDVAWRPPEENIAKRTFVHYTSLHTPYSYRFSKTISSLSFHAREPRVGTDMIHYTVCRQDQSPPSASLVHMYPWKLAPANIHLPPSRLKVQCPRISCDAIRMHSICDKEMGVVSAIAKAHCCMLVSPHRPGVTFISFQSAPVLHRIINLLKR